MIAPHPDLAQPADEPAPAPPRSRPWWRWLPFALAAVGSVAASALAPHGRRAFAFDTALDWAAISFSISKGPHVGAAAIVAFLAMLATGRRRWPLAVALTVLVGLGWEVAQTTVIGHFARLSDLLPDTLGALLGCGWAAVVLWLFESGEDGPRAAPPR